MDHDLNFEKHLSSLCKKLNRKINALLRHGKRKFLKNKIMFKALSKTV